MNVSQAASEFCVCDLGLITSAYNCMDTAFNASKPMLVGIWFMFVGGIWVQFSMMVIYGRMRTEMDWVERLGSGRGA